MSRTVRRAFAVAATCVTLLGGALVAAPAASAHDYVVGTEPATGSTVTTPPAQVTITFDDLVLDPQHDGSTSVVQVTDAAGLHYETGCASVLDRTVTMPVALGAGGAYTVTWRIVSADGHPISGTFGFTYAPQAGAASAPGATAGPACGRASGAGQAADDASGASSVGAGVLVGLGVAVVVVVVGAGVVITRRARRSLPPQD